MSLGLSARHARNLEGENKLVEAGFGFIHCCEKGEVAIYCSGNEGVR